MFDLRVLSGYTPVNQTRPCKGMGRRPPLPGVAFTVSGEGSLIRCWVYVDGFNFYHGAAKRTGHKWIDLLALSRRLRAQDTIERVKYFTAPVQRRPDDPDQVTRQRTYWRALATLGCVERIEGQFRSHPRRT